LLTLPVFGSPEQHGGSPPCSPGLRFPYFAGCPHPHLHMITSGSCASGKSSGKAVWNFSLILMVSVLSVMAKAKQQPKRILYHAFFCGDNVGEADGFFEIKDNDELELVDCWSTNDAHWRGEYMSGILSWAGVEVQRLPENRQDEGEKLLEKNWGLDGGDSGGEAAGEADDVSLYFREGTSDKVYDLELYPDVEGDPDTTWLVVARYGRSGGKLKEEIKGTGLDYSDAKTLYDRVLAEKLKKGYKQSN
jgi:hypothetical protein